MGALRRALVGFADWAPAFLPAVLLLALAAGAAPRIVITF